MTESFAALFEESELNLNVEKGAVIQGVVVSIDDDWVQWYGSNCFIT